MTDQSVCPLCGGEQRPGHTTMTIDLEKAVIVVRKVPAEVCQQCGESWIDHETARRLEGLVEEVRRKPTEVEILHWPDAA